MALVSMRELLDHAAVNTYGIPAFNVNNLEQVLTAAWSSSSRIDTSAMVKSPRKDVNLE